MNDFLLFLFTAVIAGYMECYAMEKGFGIGPPNLFGFVWQWHGALLALALTVAYATKSFDGLAWWILAEDLAFWGTSKWLLSYKYKLTRDSWICRLLGSFEYKRILVPVVHVALFAVGLVFSWHRIW